MEQDPDAELLPRLRAGDEQAFVSLVERHQAAMLRLATSFVPSQAVAEEVVQDTWMAVAARHGRLRGTLVVEDLAVPHPGQPGPDGRDPGAPQRPGRGRRSPPSTRSRFDAAGTGPIRPSTGSRPPRAAWRRASWPTASGPRWTNCPPASARSSLLRDVEELSSEEVCSVLAISDGNQRVLLHRGRSRLRQLSK